MSLLLETTRGNTTIESFKFSGGEIQVKLNIMDFYDAGSIVITATLHSSDDIMELLLACDAIKRSDSTQYLPLVLRIPYLPYARQDRVCDDGEALSLAVMAQLINSCGAESVILSDVHSPTALALINNSSSEGKKYWGSGYVDKKNTVFVAPDAGSQKSVYEVAKLYGINTIIQGYKHRDVTNGNITDIGFHGDVTGKDCIIFDDICDGGGTFIPLAQKLKAAGATSVRLNVTHGIFAKGLDIFDGIIDSVSCKYIFNHELKNHKLLSGFPS